MMLFILFTISCCNGNFYHNIDKGFVSDKQIKIIEALEEKELYNFFTDVFTKNLFDKQNSNLLKIILANNKISSEFKETLFFLFVVHSLTIPEDFKNIYEKNLSDLKKELYEFLSSLNILKVGSSEENQNNHSIKTRIETIFNQERIDLLLGINNTNSLVLTEEENQKLLDNNNSTDDNIESIRLMMLKKKDYFQDIIFYSIKAGLKNVALFLIQINEYTTLSIDNMTPLGYCIAEYDGFFDEFVSIIDLLKNKHKFIEGSLKEQISSPIAIAAKLNKRGMLEKLIKLGADPDGKDKEGNKAILIAANKGYQEIVEILLVANASNLSNVQILEKNLKKGFQSVLGSIVASGITLGMPLPDNTIKALNLNFTPGIVSLIEKAGQKHTFNHTDEYSKIRAIFKEGNWIELLFNKFKDIEELKKEESDSIFVVISSLISSLKEDILDEFAVVASAEGYFSYISGLFYKNPEVKNTKRKRRDTLFNIIDDFNNRGSNTELEEIKKMKLEIDKLLQELENNMMFNDQNYYNRLLENRKLLQKIEDIKMKFKKAKLDLKILQNQDLELKFTNLKLNFSKLKSKNTEEDLERYNEEFNDYTNQIENNNNEIDRLKKEFITANVILEDREVRINMEDIQNLIYTYEAEIKDEDMVYFKEKIDYN